MRRRRRRRALAPAAGACLVVLACAGSPAPAPPVRAAAAPEPARALPLTLPEPGALADVPAHVILVTVAGLSPEAYRSPEDGSGAPPMPRLAALARAGAAADGVATVSPASAGPAHATLVTGRTPAVHGIASDHPLGPSGIEPERHRRADVFRAPALWDATREARIPTAALGWPASVGAPVDWLFPELFPVRVGESSPAILEGAATPALLASALGHGAGEPEAGFPGPMRDGILVELACELLGAATPPRLLLLRLSQTEPVLQRDGPSGEDAAQALASADAALGRLLSCLSASGRLAQSALLVTGDAPVAPVHTLVQPNVALEAAGLLVPGPGTRTGIARWEAVARSNGTSAFVYAEGSEAALLARRALREAAERSLAFRIVSAEEMLGLGADREAWFGLEATPGHAFGDGLRRGALLLPSPARGAGGALAGAGPGRVGFVAWGAGVRERIRIPELRQTDVAPTVARLLGIALPEGEGRALVGMLRAPAVASPPPHGLPGAR